MTSTKRLASIKAEAVRIVKTGLCPNCGCGLKRNLAITGWYQCEQFGAVGFRKDDNKPCCGFQTIC